MAGEWIKVELTTATKPEILRMGRILGVDPDQIFGKWIKLWGWFDANSVAGVVDGVASTDVDALVSLDGFSAAAAQVGWLEVHQELEQVTLPNFDRHNGETAKKRAQKHP